jgi:soluble lytic murein transglycosylase-like protein
MATDVAWCLGFALWLLAMYLYCCDADAADDPATAYTADFLQHYPERRAAALALIPAVQSAAAEYNLDPLLMVMLIAMESSWKPGATGQADERGLFQIMPGGPCARGQNLTTPEGQIAAGARCLRMCADDCGGADDTARLRRMLTKYASGQCVHQSESVKRKIEYRVRKYDRLREQYR